MTADAKLQAYANPTKLVTTQWVADHLDDPNVIVIESDEDVLLYETGHIPGSVKVDWHLDLNDEVARDYVDAEGFAAVCSKRGITADTQIVFYGDNFNWWAAYALWVFSLFGHDNTALMDGGRQKWIAEGRPITTDVPARTATSYPVRARDDARIRAFQPEVMPHVKADGKLVDVRSPGEFSGELLHMADYPQEGALRGGHIPTARSVPWKRAANDDGTFRDADELRAIYQTEQGLDPSEDVIAYCRIGERSSHTWFVLTHLLGFANVRNYDGSWVEWGNTVRAPIEKPGHEIRPAGSL